MHCVEIFAAIAIASSVHLQRRLRAARSAKVHAIMVLSRDMPSIGAMCCIMHVHWQFQMLRVLTFPIERKVCDLNRCMHSALH